MSHSVRVYSKMKKEQSIGVALTIYQEGTSWKALALNRRQLERLKSQHRRGINQCESGMSFTSDPNSPQFVKLT